MVYLAASALLRGSFILKTQEFLCTELDVEFGKECKYSTIMVVTTKQVEFNLNVVNFPNPYSNIPTKQSYGDYTSQLVIFCDVNLLCKGFMENIC